MGIFASIKAAFSALGALFGFLDRRSIRRDAKAAAYGEQDRETLELVKRVRADVPADVLPICSVPRFFKPIMYSTGVFISNPPMA